MPARRRPGVGPPGTVLLLAAVALAPIWAGAPGTAGAPPLPLGPIPLAPGVWTNLTPAAGAGPPGGAGAVLVNDTGDGYVLWFGGSVAHPGGSIGATWTYANGSWTNRTSGLAFSPPARSFASVAYDPFFGTVVLFGGLGDPTYLNDTWIFKAGNWTNATGFVGVAPSPRAEAAAAYDARDSEMLLFGGVGPAGPISETWTFSGGRWSMLLPTPSPPKACCASLSYDTADSETVLLLSDGTDSHAYTWSFAGGNWTNRTGGVGPSGRQWSALVDDPSVGGALLVGGTSLPRSPFWPLADAWIFGGNRWVAAPGGAEATGAPAPRWGATAAPLVGGPFGCFLLVGGLGFNGNRSGASEVWQGCGNRTAWTNGTGGNGGGAVPPVLTLVPARLTGPVPFTTDLNVTVRGGTAPFSLSICTAIEGCLTTNGWNGTGSFHHLETFQPAGNYSITALVVDAQGLSASATASVTATQPAPLVVAPTESPDSGTVPLTAGFRAAVTGGVGPYVVQWSFGDGQVTAGAPDVNTTHVYDRVGTFYPHLEVIDATGATWNSSLTPVAVHPIPPARSPVAPGGAAFSDSLAAGILLLGIAGAVVVYAVRRRRLAEDADATIREITDDREER